MTGPPQAGDSPTTAPHPGAARLLAAASSAALLVAPFAGSAGVRTACLSIAGLTLLAITRARAFLELPSLPLSLRVSGVAWVLLAIASLAWSVDPAFTLSELKGEVLYGSLALMIFFVAARRDAAHWPRWWLALMAGCVAVIAGQAMQDGLDLPLSRHPIEGGPGAWSTHLVLVTPLVLAVGWPAPWGFGRRRAWQVAAWLALLAMVAMTGNRIAWAAVGAQLAVALACAPRVGPGGASRRQLLAIALLAVVAFGATIVERNAQLFRHAESFTTHLEHDVRPMLWRVAWREFREAPWIGHGFGREILAPVFVPHTPGTQGHPELRHAHNMFIDVALQLGVVGLATLVVLLASLAAHYVRLLARAETAPLAVMGLAILAGFVVKNLTDDFFFRHNGVVFWALNGLLIGLAQARTRP